MTTRRAPWRVRLAAGACTGTLAAASLLLLATDAAAQDQDLGGYDLLANAAAVDVAYASPGLLPVGDTILQFAVPDATTTLVTGPIATSRSSVAWPGAILSDLGPVIKQTVPPEYQPPVLPPRYPVRAEAAHPAGPESDTSEPAPGLRMHAVARGETVRADTSYTDLSLPGVFEVGSVTSDATSRVVDGTALSEGHAVLDEVSLFGGLLRIGTLTSTSRATSNGQTATGVATTSIQDVTFAGLAATIDENGLHLAEQPSPGTPVDELLPDDTSIGILADALAPVADPLSEGVRTAVGSLEGGLDEFARQSGIRVRLVPDDVSTNGAVADAAAGGVLIELHYDGRDTPVFSEVLEQLPYDLLPGDYEFLPDGVLVPPFTPQAIARLLQETHILTITLGSGRSFANASAGFVFDPAAPLLPPQAPTTTTPTRQPSQPTAPTPDPPTASAPPQPPVPTPQVAPDQPADTAASAPLLPRRPVSTAALLLMLPVALASGRLGMALADQTLGAG